MSSQFLSLAAATFAVTATIQGEAMAKTQVFVSFDYDNDSFLKEALIGQSRLEGSPSMWSISRSRSPALAGRTRPEGVACQREGTRVLPRPRDHLGRMVMVMSTPRLVNGTRRWRRVGVVAGGGRTGLR
jgi:hypothetical protein